MSKKHVSRTFLLPIALPTCSPSFTRWSVTPRPLRKPAWHTGNTFLDSQWYSSRFLITRSYTFPGMSGRWVCNFRAPSSVCRVCGWGRQWRVSTPRELEEIHQDLHKRLGGLFQHPIRDGVHTGGDFDFLDGSQGSS